MTDAKIALDEGELGKLAMPFASGERTNDQTQLRAHLPQLDRIWAQYHDFRFTYGARKEMALDDDL